MASYLVTGGAGFIGTNTVRLLLEHRHKVVVFDNYFTSRFSNIKDLSSKVKLIKGDIRNFSLLYKATQGIDCVIHLAAVPSVARSVAHPELTHDVNVNGSLNVLLAAKKRGIKRVVLASSSSVYGDTPILPKKETFPPHPLSPYAASKLFMEIYARLFWELYGVETLCLRYFNVFGPYQNPRSQYAAVIPIFVQSFLKKRKIPLEGDGLQSRDFTYVRNVAEANYLASRASKKGAGDVFNVGCGKRITLLKLVQELEKIFQTSASFAKRPQRVGDVRASLAAIQKAKKMLKYSPHVSFEAGLKRTVEWYQQ